MNAPSYAARGAGRVLPAADTEERRRKARTAWLRCTYLAGTPAAAYLARRGLPWLIGHPHLRFNAECPHPAGGTCPALVALVHDGAGAICALHRTYLTPDGGKAAVVPSKASLGPIAGAAIRLHPACSAMVVGEGLETTAAAATILGLPGWAAIAAGNLRASLVLPPGVRRVVVAADADANGVGQAAAAQAARRWQAEGRTVHVATPDVPGTDFADVLQARLAMEAAHG